jgi:Cu-Zn family superoxide dismutase
MAAGLVLVAPLVGACAEPRAASSERSADRLLEAFAELKNGQGASVGSAVLREDGGRVRVVVQARGLTPGRHAIHIHGVGRCDPPAFLSAGDHFSPRGKAHGLENPAGAHAGDLPNLEADQSGAVRYVADTDRVTLGAGPNSLLDADGSTIVIHAQPDDQRTDPSGNSGERVLCGRIVPRPALAAATPSWRRELMWVTAPDTGAAPARR